MMARAWVFGDNISTDDIIAGRYLVQHDPRELAKHVMEAVDPEFASKVRAGDVIVAGRNFGCGSSREHAPMALKGAGVAAVVATSFARIFFRNAINQGLPVLVSKEAKEGFRTGDGIRVDVSRGEVINTSTGKVYRAEPLPDFLMEILRAGGLLPYLKEMRGKEVRKGQSVI
ncbi:MAG: 3-isopropylmalate dehydratase [Candidatus Hadarchaeum yellowstonense]|uniref:3-isopropylmalate dehydratase small subunit n=1 Tax=Hadarchaeum yellowstonense TaxID=1776334 RepID=A0A147JUI4_HADYE|nr:MAG: 3-isopropylmalate dehydratase [Candidatus Hadarchaeum yellowstonense]